MKAQSNMMKCYRVCLCVCVYKVLNFLDKGECNLLLIDPVNPLPDRYKDLRDENPVREEKMLSLQ